MNRAELKTYLENAFPNNLVEETFDFPLLWVSKEELIAVASQLKDASETQFDFLFNETAIDRLSNFEIVYHLNSTIFRHDMVMKVRIEDRENPEMPSVYDFWKAAEFFENEIYDLMGIRFTNHPELRRFMLGNDWPGFPLRKDYIDVDMEKIVLG